MKNLGLVLILTGAVVLVEKGISYPRTISLIDAGPVQASYSHMQYVYVQPLAAVAAILGGVMLVLAGRKMRGV